MQVVVMGRSSEPAINAHFWHLKHFLNDNPDCHLEVGFDVELSHLIYAGADMILLPSLFEPCGLAQVIALKYGTVPIVRAVGGLVDTVFDRDYSDRPYRERNGYSSSISTTWPSNRRSTGRLTCGTPTRRSFESSWSTACDKIIPGRTPANAT